MISGIMKRKGRELTVVCCWVCDQHDSTKQSIILYSETHMISLQEVISKKNRVFKGGRTCNQTFECSFNFNQLNQGFPNPKLSVREHLPGGNVYQRRLYIHSQVGQAVEPSCTMPSLLHLPLFEQSGKMPSLLPLPLCLLLTSLPHSLELCLSGGRRIVHDATAA